MSSSEQQFRESLRSFRWASNSNSNNINLSSNNKTPFARISENTSNFFENVGNRVRGYVPLVNGNEEEEEWFALSRWQRLVGFGVFLAAGALCLLIAFMTLPMMVLRPAKFAVTFTMGSILILLSFAILHGPVAHIRHVSSRERLPFTIAYFISMAATLYFALGLKSTILALIFGVIQVIALIWYVVSYLPGGTSTLSYGSRMIARQASGILPI